MMKEMKEQIDLYTIDRERTGETAFRGTHLADGRYRLVIHVCIFNSRGEMLIQHRHPEILRWPGYWDVSVGGAATAGDTSRSAAERETREELGIELDFTRERPAISVTFRGGFDDFYLVTADLDADSLVLQAEEVTEARWASLQEIESMIDEGSFIPYEKNLLRYLFFARNGGGTWDFGQGPGVWRDRS